MILSSQLLAKRITP